MGLRGLEPPWVSPTDPKSVASASFATGPFGQSNPFAKTCEREGFRWLGCGIRITLETYKLLTIRYMPKGPKYKKGFTLRHYFDEWWDRRPHEWKVRLIVFIALVVVIGVSVSLFMVHRWMERDELMTQAKELHEKRVRTIDSRMTAEASRPPQSLMPPSAPLEVRPGE